MKIMTKLKNIITVAATTAILAISATTFGDENTKCDKDDRESRGGYHSGTEKRVKRLAVRLNLTEEQQREFASNIKDGRQARQKRHAEIEVIRVRLQQAVNDNAENIDELAGQLADLNAEGEVAKAYRLKAMNDLLTPEQKVKFAKLKEKKRKKHKLKANM